MGSLLTGQPGGAEGDRPPSAAARAGSTRREVRRLQAAISSVANCPKPVVAAVHGYCIGGGVDLIAACDIRLASADAVFSVRETKVAIVADLGSLQRLPGHHRCRPPGRAGLHGQGHRRRSGCPNRPGQRRAARRRRRTGSRPVPGRRDRRQLPAGRARHQGGAGRQQRPEGGWPKGSSRWANWNAGMLVSDDLGEAMTAFVEKRSPKFTGR